MKKNNLLLPVCLSVLAVCCTSPEDIHITVYSTFAFSVFFYRCQSSDTYSLPPGKNKLYLSTCHVKTFLFK